jgi:hypothetical protein
MEFDFGGGAGLQMKQRNVLKIREKRAMQPISWEVLGLD